MTKDLKYELIAYDLDNFMNEIKVNCFSNQKFIDLKNNLKIILALTEKDICDSYDIEIYFNGFKRDEDEILKDSFLFYPKSFSFKRAKHKLIYIKYLHISKPITYKISENDTIYNLLRKASKDTLKEPLKMEFIFAGKKIDQTIKFKDCDFFTSSDSPYGSIIL